MFFRIYRGGARIDRIQCPRHDYGAWTCGAPAMRQNQAGSNSSQGQAGVICTGYLDNGVRVLKDSCFDIVKLHRDVYNWTMMHCFPCFWGRVGWSYKAVPTACLNTAPTLSCFWILITLPGRLPEAQNSQWSRQMYRRHADCCYLELPLEITVLSEWLNMNWW